MRENTLRHKYFLVFLIQVVDYISFALSGSGVLRMIRSMNVK